MRFNPKNRIKLHSKEAVITRFTSVDSWKLPKQPSSFAPEHVWSNADQDPVPPHMRTWGAWTFVGYWFSDMVTVATWQFGSSVLLAGLSTSDAFLVMFFSSLCNVIPTVLNGAIGSKLHIPFPVIMRASYGYWFSLFCVISRAILAAFWLGVQSVGGGGAVTQAITCIWPSYRNLPNHLPASAHITTQGMTSYVIFHLIQFPMLLIPTHRLQNLFVVKTILVPPVAFGILIWICVKAGGKSEILNQPSKLQGSARAWAFLATMTSATGGWSTLAVNMPDFSRFGKNPHAQIWQAPAIPALKLITGALGIVCTGAGRVVYGQDLWTPFQIIDKWEGSGGRFLGFVCSCVWILAQISCNISGNGIAFANDVVTLAPKWFNIKRGTVLCALLGGFALVPWLMVSSAAVFLNFMSGYAIFLAPMAGMMTCDYYLVRRGKYDVPGLYDPHGRYRYSNGFNWRAVITMLFVMVPLLPGLAHTISPKTAKLNEGVNHLYKINWLYGFHATIALYWGLNYFFPEKKALIPAPILAFAEDLSTVDGVEQGLESAPTSIREKGLEGDVKEMIEEKTLG